MTRVDDLLAEYRAKRDFSRTQEPAGENRAEIGNVFVVQKHDATRLHYDFRLEYKGVLKSWAVTRGPSTDPADKRLAVRTEDHPLDYATFEGTIPKGQYGGGTVMLWDFGTWAPIEDPEEGFRTGKLKFRLDGERMKGNWALIRMKPRPGEKRENWLLIKEVDEYATSENGAALLDAATSVSTGRKMKAIAAGKPPVKRKSAGVLPLPAFVEPQLTTLVDRVPGGENWLFEMKYDGYRCLAAISGNTVRLYTRSGLDWTEKFAPLVLPLAQLTGSSVLLDGEVCAFNADGRGGFSVLKTHLSEGGPLVFFVFDMLEQGGKSIRDKPLVERKALLRGVLGTRKRDDPIQYSPDIAGNGAQVFETICKNGHEGIIAKAPDAPYRSGRSGDWLKIKCTLRQEFVIVGWSPSKKRPGVFASLLLATQEDGKLVYRGRVGTGFSEAVRAELQSMLEADRRKTAPLGGVPVAMAKDAQWVSPRHLAEIAYTEVTPDGALRHPSFLGLREDKRATGIALEKPAGLKGGAMTLRDEDGIAAAKQAGVKLSSPDKVLYPEQGITKARLAAYYAAVADTMMPFIADRPLSLVRCPAGRTGQCFFQKHDTGGFTQGMDTVAIREKDGSTDKYFTLNNLGGLLAGVQMGVLEFHIWGSRRDAIEKPDRIVFDIDPDEGLDFAEVKAAARDIRDKLGERGLTSFPLVTGGKGIHVVVPITRRFQWPDIKTFAAGFARQLAEDEPERFTATLSKKAREGRLFIDYLRNERGSTAIAPFSTRAREGAPVAVPVDWDEIEGLAAANVFSLDAAIERAGSAFWSGYAKTRQSLRKDQLE
ncbi:MAG TPA: DNA ligase D [Pelagibacterium sp.]|uniref:DNA ligase D n=1 Tax=Pelagibacterium sp. TaxID=1967288 RepID=UPI002BB3E9AF|nr:DNA ligase D [Pelagibacterium sp.]HWJ87190.1 DNA ligase D [Pelagibacterium sp.]